jgi:hypothetical protein
MVTLGIMNLDASDHKASGMHVVVKDPTAYMSGW